MQVASRRRPRMQPPPNRSDLDAVAGGLKQSSAVKNIFSRTTLNERLIDQMISVTMEDSRVIIIETLCLRGGE
jgi:hypothetical protein